MEKLSTFHKGQILTEGLILVREDICDWINKLFDKNDISGNSFLPSMHNGILLCDLIQKIYFHIFSSSSLPQHWPRYPPQPDRKATPGSFKAKDNITLFLNWCRIIGLSNTILFETKGLVNSDEEKNVVLTLLHVGEVCVDFDIPVPEFAKFNKEMMMAKSKMKHTCSVYALEDATDSVPTENRSLSARSESNIFQKVNSQSTCTRFRQTQKLPMTKRENLKKMKKKSTAMNSEEKNVDKTYEILVKEAKTKCQCQTKFSIERTNLQEGMYKIGTKNIFVRLFRDNIMLRVGGGWETLNEYMNKVDPCCKSGNSQDIVSQKRQSLGSSVCNKSLTTEKLIKSNLRKMSESELINIRKKFGVLNHSPTTCK